MLSVRHQQAARLTFCNPPKHTSVNLFCFLTFAQVLHSLVCSVDKLAATPSGCPLLIHCKNFQVLHFIISKEQECHDIHLSLQRLSQPGELCHYVSKGLDWIPLWLSSFFFMPAFLYHCKYPKYPVNICSFGLVFISSAFATLWPFGLKQVEGCAHQPLAVSPCFVFQRVMTSCTASPISQMLMRRRDDRNGTSWTSRLITAEWDSQALCGNSPQLTNTTRSLSWP